MRRRLPHTDLRAQQLVQVLEQVEQVEQVEQAE
jgi:hypothetical protein